MSRTPTSGSSTQQRQREGQPISSIAQTAAAGPDLLRRRCEATTSKRYQAILEVAAELFLTHGYRGTSVQAIADAVGILKGSIYYYITTKEDLLNEIICIAHNRTAAVGKEALELHGGPAEQLQYLVAQHLREAERHLAELRVFYREAEYLSSERRAEIAAHRDSYEAALRLIVERGQLEGAFAPHLSVTFVTLAILAILNSVEEWLEPNGDQPIDEVVDKFSAFIMQMVSC